MPYNGPYREPRRPTRYQADFSSDMGKVGLCLLALVVAGLSLFWPYLVWHGTQPNYPYHDTWTPKTVIAEGSGSGACS